MTNIQAIDLLKGLEQSLDDYCELNDEGKTAFHMAITALEVFGNSEQLPSAQPEHIADDERKIADLHKMVNYLLSRLEQRWIPCGERLPEEKDAGILKKLGTEKRSEYVLATVEVKDERMTVTACTYDGVWHWDKKYAFPDYKIIAWMPLPEPYKEDPCNGCDYLGESCVGEGCGKLTKQKEVKRNE